MMDRLERFFMQRITAERRSVTEMLTSPTGIFRISSVKSLPGSTAWPSSLMEAAFVYSMTSDPSEQIIWTRFSDAVIRMPSRICFGERGASALVTVFRPSSRSWEFIVKIMQFNLASTQRSYYSYYNIIFVVVTGAVETVEKAA